MPATTLNRYAGVYDMGQGVTITVTLEGEQLFAQMTKQPRFELFAETETAFFPKVVDAQVEFVHGAGGEVRRMPGSAGLPDGFKGAGGKREKGREKREERRGGH